ncbi:MAG: sugar transferase, partial [Actinomycetota bacterium]|nr:sugar transferase [Actinomycetota bacterium]
MRSPSFIAVVLRGAVCSLVLGAVVIVWELTNTEFSTFFSLSAALSLVVLMLRGDLRMRMVPDLIRYVPRVLASVTIGTGFALIIDSASGLWGVSGEVLVRQLAVLTIAVMFGVYIGLRLLRRQWRAGALRSRAIIVGTTELAVEFAVEISQRDSYGVNVVGLVGDQVNNSAGAPFLGGVDMIQALVEQHRVDRLIVMPGVAGDEFVLRSLRWANTRPGLNVFVVPRFFDLGSGMDSVAPDRVRGYPLTQLDRVSHREFGLAAKRVFDVLVAGLALLVLAPLLLAIAAAVKLSDRKGPVFFKQERVGLYGKPINVMKFRSMRVSESSDTEWMGEADARITRVGSLLRRTSLDETPQLINVVRGDMSLVGPRPER